MRDSLVPRSFPPLVIDSLLYAKASLVPRLHSSGVADPGFVKTETVRQIKTGGREGLGMRLETHAEHMFV